MAGSELLVFLTVLLPAALLGLASKRLGLPSIVGYVVAGILVGPALHLIDVQDPLLVFLAELGIILVAFQIGLTVKMDFLRRWGKPGGIVLVEVVAVWGLTLLVGTMLDLPFAAVYVLAFMALNTSTAVVFFLLRDEEGTESVPADVVFGVGALEDIVSLIGLALLPLVVLSEQAFAVEDLVRLLFFIVVSIALMLVFGLKLARGVIQRFGLRDKELLIVLSATLVIAYAFLGELIGLSPSLGAFIAGLAASSILEAEEVKEGFLSFTEVAALFFFAFVGASLPIIADLGVVLLIVAISLAIIVIKYASFGIATWLFGVRLEDAFRFGLYMLAISEFGIILALEGFQRGAITQEIYLVAVVAMVVSTILAAATRPVREVIPRAIARAFPKHLRSLVEATAHRVRQAFSSDAEEMRNIKVAGVELLKRGAIVTLLAFLFGVLTEAVPPYFGASAALAEAVLVAVGSLLVLATVYQSKDAMRDLIHFALRAHRETTHRRAVAHLADVVHVTTIGLTAVVLILFYSPFLVRLLELFLAGGTTKLVVVGLVILVFALLARRIARFTARVDELFAMPDSPETEAPPDAP